MDTRQSILAAPYRPTTGHFRVVPTTIGTRLTRTETTQDNNVECGRFKIWVYTQEDLGILAETLT